MEKLRRFVNKIFSLIHWIVVKVMTGHTLESGSPSPSTLSASYLSDTAASDSEHSPGIHLPLKQPLRHYKRVNLGFLMLSPST